MTRTALITGANGRIGCVLVRELLQNHDVKIKAGILPGSGLESLRGVDGIELVDLDITDPQSAAKAVEGVQDLYHIAGLISVRPADRDKLMRVNVMGTQNMLQAALQAGVERALYTGSCDAYRVDKRGQIIDERCPLHPNSELGYASSKAQALQFGRSMTGRGMKLVEISPTGVVGPLDFEPSLTGQVMLQALRLKEGQTANAVDASFDQVDVRDLARTMAGALERGKDGGRYLAGGSMIPNAAFIEACCKHLQKPRIRVMPTKVALQALKAKRMGDRARGLPDDGMVDSLRILEKQPIYDSHAARHELGHENRPIKEMIEDTVDWLREHHLQR